MKFIKSLMPKRPNEPQEPLPDDVEEEALESEFDRILYKKQTASETDLDDEDWDDEDWDDEDEDDEVAEAPAAPAPRRVAAEAPQDLDLAALSNLLKSDMTPARSRDEDEDAFDDEDEWDDLDFDEDDFAEDDELEDEPIAAKTDDAFADDFDEDDALDDDEFEQQPPAQRANGRKIWDLENFQEDHLQSDTDEGEPHPAPVPVAAAAATHGRAGRVKTRLLGFQTTGMSNDIFSAVAGHTTSDHAMFPVGWIIVVEGQGRGACFTLTNGVAQIGRGEDQTVRLDFGDTSISRQNHAAVAYDDEMNQFFLGHGGKSNLVRLNGRPVLSTEQLSDGDLIRIGETTLRFVALCGEDFSWREEGGDDLSYAAAT